MCVCRSVSCELGLPGLSELHSQFLQISAGHHRSLSSGQSGLPRSYSSSHLSSLDRRRSGSCVVSIIEHISTTCMYIMSIIIYCGVCCYVNQSLPGKLHSGRAFDTGCNCVIDESKLGNTSLSRCICSVSFLVFKGGPLPAPPHTYLPH